MSTVNVKLLPDGSGRVRIHWFVHDDDGPIVTPAGQVKTSLGILKIEGIKGYIACSPQQKTITPQSKRGQLFPTVHSDDVRAATCPECLATDEAKEMMRVLAENLDTSDIGQAEQ